jgi:hypothetical protein
VGWSDRPAGLALVQPQRFVRELGSIAAADQQPPGTVALAVVTRRLREPPPQERKRDLELRLGPVRLQRGVDAARRDASTA